MKKRFVSIGIDVSKTVLDIHWSGVEESFPMQFPNHADGIAELLQWLQAAAPAVIVCEPSGG